MHDEPITDLAHLGHLELLTPKPEESLRFFVDVMGMTESGRQGDSVYLHAWDDYERYSLQLTASHTSGLGHAAFRARSPQALQRRVKAVEESGLAIGWHENELGHGPGFRFHDPDGHVIEIYYETEWYEAPARAATVTQEPGATLSGARRQCPPAGPFQLPRRGRGGEPDLLREVSWVP